MAGTPNLDWAREQIADTPSFAEIEKKLENIPAGSGGVIYHPYLGSAGERAPFYSPNARASFFGLNTSTTRYHLVKAVYEGIAFSIKDCLYKYSNSKSLSICGGGAKSRVWAQIIADVTGRVVSVHDGTEFGAKGAVMLAGVHLGVFKDYNDASQKLCHIVATYEPNAKNAKLYDDLYELYLESRIAFMPLWDKRRQIMDANN
jgi:xylulokinase